jgi:YesN/AraC family two-component response regulator
MHPMSIFRLAKEKTYSKKILMTHLLKYIKNYACIICFFFITQSIIAQEEGFIIPDSLKDKTYSYLFTKLRNNYTDTISSLVYLNTTLKKATIEDNKANVSYSLLMIGYYTKDEGRKLDLIKKSIIASKSADTAYKILPRLNLGLYYYNHFEYEKALQEYLEVLRVSKKTGYVNYEFITLGHIAELKRDIGKHEEALELYKKSLYYETSKKNKHLYSITAAYTNIAESMRYNKKNDSASYYYNIIKEKGYKKDLVYLNVATINQGINLYEIGNFEEATRLLNKGSNDIDLNHKSNRKYHVLSQFYLGKINQLSYNDLNKARDYFLKVDSLLTTKNIVISETREAYEFLIKDYKEQGNLEAQLATINKLIRFDSITSSRKIRIVNTLHLEFDTPQLLKSKETIIKSLKRKTNILTNRTFYLIAFGLLFFLLFILQYNKHRKYKKRFNAIISELNTKKTKSVSHSNLSITPQLASIIDEATVTAIVKKLDHFETKKEFLQNDLNLAIVAKKCDTNAKYLSKIINAYKDQSFVNYINTLRVDYILKELKDNTILQKYTIKSISEEAGFNTAESFAIAFKKRTGIRPSYYIRNLKNK